MNKFITVPTANTTLSLLSIYTQKLMHNLMLLIPNNHDFTPFLYNKKGTEQSYFLLKLDLFYDSGNILSFTLKISKSLHIDDLEYYIEYTIYKNIQFVVSLSHDNLPEPSHDTYFIVLETSTIKILNKKSSNVSVLMNDIQHSYINLIEFTFIP
jgi:hypothetical protein